MDYPTNNGQLFAVNAPQLEDGFTRIANELLEAICRFKINGESLRIFLAIIRFTYGWNRKEAVIRNFELVEMTGINRHNVIRAIKRLTASKMINVIETDNKSYPKYCINKNYSEWIDVIETDNMLSKRITHVIDTDNKMLSKRITSTPSEPLQDNGSRDPKDSKDILKDREKSKRRKRPSFTPKDNAAAPLIHPLQTWISENLENVSRMKKQLTGPECQRLIEDYPKDSLKEYLFRMDNYVPLTKKCFSVNLTLRNWLNRGNIKKLGDINL